MAEKVESRLPSVMQKTTFSVSGLCCASEAALVHKLLEPLQGIENVSVNTVAKTVIVLHDSTQVPASHIVDALNKAKLNASIRELGKVKERRKPWPSWNIIACGLLLIIAMFSYIYQPLIWIALASIAVGILGMLRRSWAALRRFVLDINVLMVIAAFGAIGLGDFIEGASIVFLFTFAEWLEEMSTDKARNTLESLINSAPRTAVIAENGEVVPVENVRIDTIVSVKAGEQVPVDGVIVSGESSVDESSLTGEFMPVDKQIGSNVWAGTVVLTGYINVAAKAIKDDSAVARMVKLVEDAQNQRSKIEEFIEKFAKYYTPGVVLIAGVIAIVPLVLRLHEIHQWLYLSLVLVVVACPCALVISTPVAKVCGLSAAAKMGLRRDSLVTVQSLSSACINLAAMVGDGINDAPALATSDVGIAMGVAGSAVATETADVALLSNDLRKISEAVKLARSSLRKVYQNVALSLIVKIIFFALAFGGVASLWAAVVADMGTSLLVTFNSILLLRTNAKTKQMACEESCQKTCCSTAASSSSAMKDEVRLDLEVLHEPLLPKKERTENAGSSSCCKGCCGGTASEAS